MKHFTKYLLGFFCGVATCLVVSYVVVKYYPNILFTPQPPKISLAKIPKHEIQMYKSKYAEIRAGKNMGSGCELEPGVILTAFHNVMLPWIDKEQIYVNNVPAILIWHGRTEQDYAILSTKGKIDPKKIVIPNYDFEIGDDIVVVGSPGNLNALVEPGKIIDTNVKDDSGQLKIGSKEIFSIYIESGISGGCVYPAGSDYPVAIVTKKDGNPEKNIGEISMVSKTFEEPTPAPTPQSTP